MVKSAPHLLATDIVESLRRAGFTAVTLDESEEEPSGEALNLTGSFTKLNPGSQNTGYGVPLPLVVICLVRTLRIGEFIAV